MTEILLKGTLNLITHTHARTHTHTMCIVKLILINVVIMPFELKSTYMEVHLLPSVM